ncbi:alpha-amylase family glycosyl hydrolase [Microbacterium sp. W1N]|uniref:alpha-amylase family glycosyl hydrolase n=1 Tax=Microbacterium festucae TaxID=2977531 RepID=UPI0021C003DF|nr:alpha-amylase family glycosyl hydrolase [Microbacterium festucae]MCT9819540.1 alpha-amylase family glycosyl hydrolase [Microbacterium festucae]
MATPLLSSRLDRAVLYQVYPQSFADADGDGIGDLAGLAARLDHLSWLGVDAVWISPCFASPFRDAGYDVEDFTRIAPRYGGDAAFEQLMTEADRRGIAVLFDLVAGHTSDTHAWFRAAIADPDDDRYVFSDAPAPGFEPVPGARGGYYLPNFFAFQPALNFGYARQNPDEPWRQPVDADGPRRNRDALVEIMGHWFDRGVQGFRVDMAASLVKDDPGHVETARLWRDLRARIDARHPGRVLISEWGDPARAVPAGFDVDFFLQFGGDFDGRPLKSLWNNGSGTVHEAWGDEPAWADAAGRGDAAYFVDAWREARAAIDAAGSDGLVGLPTSNHDFTRLVSGDRDAAQARAALLLALTWPALPSIYYGEEIGMRYVPGLASLEGSSLGPTYERAGSRTPMQWGELPAGAVPTAPSRYLPEDPDPARPTVAAQRGDESSLLHFARAAIALRRTDPRLSARAAVEVVTTGYPFVYRRGETLLVALNPSAQPREVALPASAGPVPLAFRAAVDGRMLRLEPFGCAVVDLAAVDPAVDPAE